MKRTFSNSSFFQVQIVLLIAGVCTLCILGCKKDFIDTPQESQNEEFLFSPVSNDFVRGGLREKEMIPLVC